MARRVTYQILDMPDGRFAVAATIEPDKTVFRNGFATQAEADAWVEGLRAIMAALGAPVSLAVREYPGSLPLDEVLAFLRKAPTETG
ncbi:hypothetical protein VQ02_08680 [Methylobacterium variabile]|jgi:hypothetical protein|uniref:Uncharacterized protein n=1 Tax=Methylobacterium variabile TaxID=298794 RepID=A0A0J6T2Q9_9HYPH|nr:hypothetical protein [Methylobacterium variabile]KMO40092.1 hypothetical protein VQ02_08680 [Methylobacterium variabile]